MCISNIVTPLHFSLEQKKKIKTKRVQFFTSKMFGVKVITLIFGGKVG